MNVPYRTVAQVAHAGVPQQLPKHARSRFLPRLQHLHRLVTKEDEEVWPSRLCDACVITAVTFYNCYIYLYIWLTGSDLTDSDQTFLNPDWCMEACDVTYFQLSPTHFQPVQTQNTPS